MMFAHLPTAYRQALEAVLGCLGLGDAEPGLGCLRLREPSSASNWRRPNSPFPIAEAMAICMAAAAAAAAAVGRLRGIDVQHAELNLQTALAHVHAERMFGPTLNGRALASAMVRDNPLLATPYRCGDGLWVMPSALHPQLQLKWLRFLQVPPTADAVARAIGQWQGEHLEDAASSHHLPIAVCRTLARWREHPHGRQLLGTKLVMATLKNQLAPRPMPQADRPLSGVRVLLLTQGVAGPVAGRTLAEQGADVLHLGDPEGFEHEAVWCEGYVGCRSMGLNFREEHDRRVAEDLLQRCDVVVASVSERAQRHLGIDEATLQNRFPHIIAVRLSAYGSLGLWRGRPGFDMNAMAATGMMLQQAQHVGGEVPSLPPTLLLNDFLMGYLAAAAACGALLRRTRRGEVLHMELNLTRVALWCQDLPRAGTWGALDRDDREPAAVQLATPLGLLRRLAPGVRLSQTPGMWPEPALMPRLSLASDAGWLSDFDKVIRF